MNSRTLNNLLASRSAQIDEYIDLLGEPHLIPWLYRLKSTEQDTIWHAEGDVHIHTRMVMEAMAEILSGDAAHLSDEDKSTLMLAALLHDIGKPETTYEKFQDGRMKVKASNHEQVGLSYLTYRLAELPLTAQQYRDVLALVGYHQVPKLLVVKNQSKWAYYALARKVRLELLYYLEQADMIGRICADLDEQLEYLELFRLYAEEYGCYTSLEGERAALSALADNPYMYTKGFSALLAGEIIHPEEALSKFYEPARSHPRLILTSGISGVGKSTWIEREHPQTLRISLDEIREEIGGHRQNFKHEGQVVNLAKERLKQALREHRTVIYESTGLRRDLRKKVIALAENYHAVTTCVLFTDAFSTVTKQNANRTHAVDTGVHLKQLHRFEFPELDETDHFIWWHQGQHLPLPE
jgi:putative nucleotidyltransferase with HDIG domain